jgi:hypothetical protein
LLGLPVISGPVSVLLFLEHGPHFARDAAAGTLLGLVAASTFSVTYAVVAAGRSWWRSLLLATAACLGVAALLAWVHPDFSSGMALALIALAAFAWRVGAPKTTVSRPDPSAADLAFRMVVAGVVVFVVTSCASLLGSTIAGLLAPLPVVAAIMTASLHRRGGRDLADNLVRGTLIGAWGGAAFFAVVGSLMSPGYVLETYVLASAAALAAAALASRAPMAAREVRRVAGLVRIPGLA